MLRLLSEVAGDRGESSSMLRLLSEVADSGKFLLKFDFGQLFYTVEGDMAASWGLDLTKAVELQLEPVKGEPDPAWEQCGELYFTKDILPYLKSALTSIVPDGYCFTGHPRLVNRLSGILGNVAEALKVFEDFFSGTTSEDWAYCANAIQRDPEDGKHLYYTYSMINIIKSKGILATSGVILKDQRIIAQASYYLRRMLEGKQDLIWAMQCASGALKSIVGTMRNMKLYHDRPHDL